METPWPVDAIVSASPAQNAGTRLLRFSVKPGKLIEQLLRRAEVWIKRVMICFVSAASASCFLKRTPEQVNTVFTRRLRQFELQ